MAGFPGFSVGNLFRNTPQVRVTNQPSQQQQPGQQQPLTAPQGGQQSPQQQLPQGAPGSSMQQQPGQQPGASSSPLDAFTDVWKNDTTANPNQGEQDPFSQPLFQADPAKIREAASKMDFMSQVPPELLQKVMAGNDPQALIQLINSVAQNSMALSVQLNTATAEQAGTKIGERFNKALPERFRSLQIDSQQSENPALNHPAVRTMLKNAKDQIRRNEPNLSAEQVHRKAEQLMMAMSEAMNPQQPKSDGFSATGSGGNDNMDWLAWAQSEAPSQQ